MSNARKHPTDVVGNSIASAVAVDRLAAAGVPVRWYRTSRSLSGGFQPLVVDGRRLELGMRVVELSYDSGETVESPSVLDYEPGPHGHRPFLGVVESFIRSLAATDLYSVSAGEVWVNKRRGADLIVAGDLIDLPRLVEPDVLRRIAAEAHAAVATVGPHGLFESGSGSEALMTQSFEAVARAHCGDTFYETILAPLMEAILPGAGGDVIAALHRKIWLPLFHPISVLESASGSLSYRPDRPLYSLHDGGMGKLFDRLEARIGQSELVEIVTIGGVDRIEPGEAGSVSFVESESGEFTAESPIVGLDPIELFTACGAAYSPTRARTAIAWIDCALPTKPLPSVMWMIDADIPAYRVTRNRGDDDEAQTATWIVELSRSADEDQLVAEAQQVLATLGLTSEPGRAIKSAAIDSFVAPTFSNSANFSAARSVVDDQALPMEIVGGALAFGVDSLNEQIVQGMRAAKRKLRVNAVLPS